jgi:NTE family protein
MVLNKNMTTSSPKEVGMVLSGGGARGAYQAGVLHALYEIFNATEISFPRIIAGVSAGAINAAFLASQMDEADHGIPNLCQTWKNLHAENVFRTDYTSVTRNALKLVRGVSFGGIASAMRSNSKVGLLNTAPLEKLLADGVDFGKIQTNIDNQLLKGLAVSATDYSTAFGVTFVQSRPDVKMWYSANRFSVHAQITVKHIMASSAIPIFFPAGEIESRFYGDGCLRNTAPLSPAVHMGADKLVVIGVRTEKRIEDFKKPSSSPSFGRLLSVLINAIFMDSIEVDLERLRIVNESIERFNLKREKSNFKTIPSLYLHPSRDLARMAQDNWSQLPAIIRFLFNGLGTPEESADLLSYLLFEPSYCSSLTELGYEDTLQRKDEVIDFFTA